MSQSLLASATAPHASTKHKTIELYNPSHVIEFKSTGILTFRWSFSWEESVSRNTRAFYADFGPILSNVGFVLRVSAIHSSGSGKNVILSENRIQPSLSPSPRTFQEESSHPPSRSLITISIGTSSRRSVWICIFILQ
jgi:hypothetical protein